MPRVDRPLVLTILFAVLVTAMAGALHQVSSGGGCIELLVASSQEKSTLMQEAAAAFNNTRPAVAGRCLDVNVEQVVSGAAEKALEGDWKGQVIARPDVWSPAATTWLALLGQQRIDRKLPPLFGPATSLMQSPLAIAMPEPMAKALGWPTQPIGWKTIFDLAQDPRGWARYGRPDWGLFRLGKTNPDLSTSGLNALISTYYAASGKASNLTLADLERPDVSAFVKEVESSVAHYGDTATTFLNNLRAAQQNSVAPYVSAVAVEEKEVWNYNIGNVTGDPSRLPTSVVPNPLLAAIYPSDGTLLADHPYVLLNWPATDGQVASAKKAASDKFLEYLLSPRNQETFQAAGFRNYQGKGGLAISPINDLNPAKPNIVELPTPDVIAAIQASWATLRKPARVLIVVDVSASAGAGGLAGIKSSLAGALRELGPGDQVGLWQAPGATNPFDELVPVGALTPTQVSLIDAKIQAMEVVKAQSPLVDLVRSGVTKLRATYDPGRINAVVLLSPGTGATSTEVEALLQSLRDQPANQPIHVFTVSYGDHPDTGGNLSRIALNSGGFYNAASPASFHDLMIQVLSNF
jgi:Ca-activated chloride channel family protein